jgi:hypothetical protein
MCYNFARVHQTLRVTPAMKAALSDHLWSVEEIVGFSDDARNACNDVSAAGCCTWILGGSLLFRSTNHNVTDGPVEWGGMAVPELLQNQRKALTRFGFGFLTLGSTLQMMGVLAGMLSN